MHTVQDLIITVSRLKKYWSPAESSFYIKYNLTKINYKQRKTITGKFNEYGPEHAKENYNFNIKTCHCPPFYGPLKNNIKTKKCFQQEYPKRVTTTAMFYDNGPLPNNEYDYDSFINGCDCPKCGAS